MASKLHLNDPIGEDIAPLFEPLTIRSVTLKNRIVMSPMTRQFSPGGVPGEDVAAYYTRRAEGLTGLVITEGSGIDHPAAVDSPRVPALHGEAAMEGWRRVVQQVHAVGGVIFPQLWHQGVLRNMAVAGDPTVPAQRPSGLFGPIGVTSLDPAQVDAGAAPTEPMTDSEIADVIEAYARSARNSIDAGFDGIAIHGAHGYLIDTFLWDKTNIRADKYGGDHAGRARFAVEVVKAVRVAIGPDRPIEFRFSQHKQQDYKARLADTPDQLGAMLGPIADAGVDIFDASLRRFETPTFEGSDLNLAGWAKKLTGKLSMTVGSIGLGATLEESFKSGTAAGADNIPSVLERFNRGDFDLVGVGRALLGDPAWTRKLRQGKPFEPFQATALQSLV